MVFGIDLGTTNSLIGVGDQLLSGLVSSSVNVASKKQVPRDSIGDDIVSSYKTNISMSTDGELSIQCSAVVLKELARVGTRRYGEEVKSVVISVPAYFSTSQREAVYKAAEIAGLEVTTLINEPTAAALYVCKDLKDLVVVYDLGGGTFDVSIVDSRTGFYSVIATDGIVLGGDDLDKAMVANAFSECKVAIRKRSRENVRHLQVAMRVAKETIQQTGADQIVDMSFYGCASDYVLTLDKYKELIRDVFGKTFDITRYVVATNVQSCEHPKVVFVGGSAMCPYLRDMLKTELNLEEISATVNADYIVAKGVALYAEMLNEGTALNRVEDVTKRLCIEEDSGRSITVIDSNTIIPCRNTVTMCNGKEDSKLRLKLYQGDQLLAVKNDYIGTLVYDYGDVVPAGEGIVEITVEVSHSGVISLRAVDILFDDAHQQEIKLTSR